MSFTDFKTYQVLHLVQWCFTLEEKVTKFEEEV